MNYSVQRLSQVIATLKNSRGFTLAEVLIASAILGVLAITSGSIVVNLAKMQKTVDDKVIVNEFLAQMGQYFRSASGCDALKNKILTSAKEPLILTDFMQYYANSTDEVKDGSVIVPSRVRVNSITVRRAPNTAPVATSLNGVNFSSTSAEVAVALQIMQAGGETLAVRERVYTIPVLTNSANIIQHCGSGDTANFNQSCIDAGGTINSATGQCEFPGQCDFGGSYTVITCTHNGNPYTGDGCQAGIINPMTGGPVCPFPGMAKLTGEQQWTNQVNCGKKCTRHIVNTEQNFGCVQCP